MNYDKYIGQLIFTGKFVENSNMFVIFDIIPAGLYSDNIFVKTIDINGDSKQLYVNKSWVKKIKQPKNLYSSQYTFIRNIFKNE